MESLQVSDIEFLVDKKWFLLFASKHVLSMIMESLLLEVFFGVDSKTLGSQEKEEGRGRGAIDSNLNQQGVACNSTP